MPRHNTGRGGRHGQHRIVPTRFTSSAFQSCAPTKSVQLFRDIGRIEWSLRGDDLVERHTWLEQRLIVARLREKGERLEYEASMREWKASNIERTVPICSICMEYKTTDVVILRCHHIFCRICISTWSFKSTTDYGYPRCPTCRSTFNPDDLEPYPASYADAIKYL